VTTSLAGLVLEVGSEGARHVSGLFNGPYVFLAATEARVVVELGAHTMVDRALGIGIGVASVQGQLVTLLDIDPEGGASKSPTHPRSEAFRQVGASADFRTGVLSEIDSGESVLLLGGRILATGLFPIDGVDAVLVDSRTVEVFSIAKLYRKIETRIWERRALTPQARLPASRRSEGRFS